MAWRAVLKKPLPSARINQETALSVIRMPRGTLVFIAALAIAFCLSGAVLLAPPSPAELGRFETLDLPPRPFRYRMAGDFNEAGRPVDAPMLSKRPITGLRIMKHQVTAADYDRCVSERACAQRALSADNAGELPAVQVSWQDATAFATWLSAKTGETWRLPTDEEWVFAAGSRFHDDALLLKPSNDPSARWLARFEKESQQPKLDERPRPIGSFGANEHGLLDLSGNVWEWTNTCFIRRSLDAKRNPVRSASVNCGVRVVEGEHRTYVTDFIRDARVGGCAVRKPPSNLGFRRVDDGGRMSFMSLLSRLFTVFRR